MDNYFTDYETLGKVIDQLISQKFPGQPQEQLESLRENSIQELDDQIGTAVISSLSKDQLDEFNVLLDREEEDPAAFRDFFEKSSIDLDAIMTKTIKTFSEKYLGGENA